jgi:mannose-1-phosphate guanylyltransferase
MIDAAHRSLHAGFCVIMAGGRGTRFWPLSRRRHPKQLLALGSSLSLLRETYERVLPLTGPERVLVVTGADLAAAVMRELPELPVHHVVGEPVGRNTAPCAALGITLSEHLAGRGPVALLPADHHIPDADVFCRQLSAAFAHAAAEAEPVTFGIAPDRPETGYGYIETAGADGRGAGSEAGGSPLRGVRFVEKPDGPTAAAYLASGRHLWNSGIFVWDSRAFAAALQEHLPAVAGALAPALAAFGSERFATALGAAYGGCPAVSLDVGIMEKLPGFAVFRADFRWSDIGSWDAWAQLAPRLEGENRGRADLLAVDSRGNAVHALDKLVALVGVEDLVIVDTPDALLVCRKQDAQRIREVTDRLAVREREDLI